MLYRGPRPITAPTYTSSIETRNLAPARRPQGAHYGRPTCIWKRKGLYRAKNPDRLSPIIPDQFLAYKNGSHRGITPREAARLQFPVEPVVVRRTVLQPFVHVSRRKLTAHFIAMPKWWFLVHKHWHIPSCTEHNRNGSTWI